MALVSSASGLEATMLEAEAGSKNKIVYQFNISLGFKGTFLTIEFLAKTLYSYFLPPCNKNLHRCNIQ